VALPRKGQLTLTTNKHEKIEHADKSAQRMINRESAAPVASTVVPCRPTTPKRNAAAAIKTPFSRISAEAFVSSVVRTSYSHLTAVSAEAVARAYRPSEGTLCVPCATQMFFVSM